MLKRVYYKVNGEILITTFNKKLKKSGETDDAFMDRIQATLAHGNLPFDNVVDDSIFPLNHAVGYKWRGQKGTGIFIDNFIQPGPKNG